MKSEGLRDEVDFDSKDIPKLFKKILIPTLLGMFFTALFIITDGIFVGRGIGSDALAAVNIVAPFFSVASSIGLMLGMGGSILASMHLASGKYKTARIVVTQAIFAALVSLVIVSVVLMVFIDDFLIAIGATPELLPMAREYGYGIVPFLFSGALINSVPFFIRLDGAPNFAMKCCVVGAIVNIILDYLFIFEFGWGLYGAAIATSIGNVLGAVMAVWYLWRGARVLSFVRVKLSRKSARMSLRNLWYMCRLGGASFIGQSTVIVMIICGNLVFSEQLGTDGVAAFSVCCYMFPLIYMIYTAVAQSAQPIISYNYAKNFGRQISEAFRISLVWGVGIGVVLVLGVVLFSAQISGLFLESGSEAYHIARVGLPLFAIGFIPFAINTVTIAYWQSIKEVRLAIILIILRGVVFMILFFWIMPIYFGGYGGWLAVPAAELSANFCLAAIFLYRRCRRARLRRQSLA